MKIYESEDHQTWYDVAWAMWNSGYFNTYSTHSVNIGLYLTIKSNTVYQPLAQRESFILEAGNMQNSSSALWYNPEQSGHGLSVYMLEDKRIVVIWYVYDNQGQFELEFSGCDSGLFKWIPNIGNGFNAGEMNVVRLTNTPGLTCSEATTIKNK